MIFFFLMADVSQQYFIAASSQVEQIYKLLLLAAELQYQLTQYGSLYGYSTTSLEKIYC